MIRPICSFALLLVLQAPARAAGQSVTYDLYDRGVHLAEFSVPGATATPGSFTVRRKDIRQNTWGSPVSVPRDGRSDRRELTVANLGNLALLSGVSEIDWKAQQVVA